MIYGKMSILSCCNMFILHIEMIFVPHYLCSNKIAEDLFSCSKLDEITSLEQGCNAIAQSFSYGECYHAIDIIRLIPLLYELQSSIVQLAFLTQKPSE